MERKIIMQNLGIFFLHFFLLMEKATHVQAHQFIDISLYKSGAYTSDFTVIVNFCKSLIKRDKDLSEKIVYQCILSNHEAEF